MKKYLAITAALALALTACGQTTADSTPTPRLRPQKPQRLPPSSRRASAAAPCGC